MHRKQLYFYLFVMVATAVVSHLAQIQVNAWLPDQQPAASDRNRYFWQKVSPDGFGDPQNDVVLSLLYHYWGHLIAGTRNLETGGQVWRMNLAGEWQPVTTDGFANPDNIAISAFYLSPDGTFAATHNEKSGAEIWRSPDGAPGTWEQVVAQGFGDPENREVTTFSTFYDQMIYVGTGSGLTPASHGAEIWRSSNGSAGSWQRVASNGFNGDVNNQFISAFGRFGGYLFAGTWNEVTGGEVWRSLDGLNWQQVNTDGFGSANNVGISALLGYNGRLYASTHGKPGWGLQIWACYVCDSPDGWHLIADNGFGNAETFRFGAFERILNDLYFAAGNSETGMEVWHTTDGVNWNQVGLAGFGEPDNIGTYRNNNFTIFSGELHVGAWNPQTGGQIWKYIYLSQQIYLPLMVNHP